MSYKGGPNAFPPEMARNLLEALHPVCDLLADEPSRPTKVVYKSGERKIEENRWAFYRVLGICYEVLKFQSEGRRWDDSPIQRRWSREYSRAMMAGNVPWWSLRCGRPTKKGEPCKARLNKGRAACWRHSTEEENSELRYWQDAVHLPFPRVGSASAGKFEIDQAVSGLRAMLGELADAPTQESGS